MRGLCLVTGASGYVGSRLVEPLLEAGFSVRVLVRNPEKIARARWRHKVDVVTGDAADAHSLKNAMNGVSVAYYLLHSIAHGEQLEHEEALMANLFAATAAESRISRIVYLGGLAPQVDPQAMSRHMRSRARVGKILLDSPTPTCELRAAVIVGSGSASFEMVRYLADRLPLMITPRWVRQRTQPIAVEDVLYYLVAAARLPPGVNRSFDIGGPDVMTYQDMLKRYSKAAGLKRRIILPINVLTPGLSSRWVGLVTPVPAHIARPLAESLRHPAVCDINSPKTAFLGMPPHGPKTFEQAVTGALATAPECGDDMSASAAQAAPTDPPWAGGSRYEDLQRIDTTADPQQIWRVVNGIGGKNGWYSAGLLWRIRGLIDRAVGGPGMRRTLRPERELQEGDTVDFWTVEAIKPGQCLCLRAEMKLPGLARLEFSISTNDAKTRLTQRAVFVPRGLAGHLYWAAISPFHRWIFPHMAATLIAQAEMTTPVDAAQ